MLLFERLFSMKQPCATEFSGVTHAVRKYNESRHCLLARDWLAIGRRGGLMVNTLDSESSAPGSIPGLSTTL